MGRHWLRGRFTRVFLRKGGFNIKLFIPDSKHMYNPS